MPLSYNGRPSWSLFVVIRIIETSTVVGHKRTPYELVAYTLYRMDSLVLLYHAQTNRAMPIFSLNTYSI